MQSETIPSELNLSAPPTIPQARTYISKQKSEYTEYDVTKGTKIRVDIPRLQKSYLTKESYIRFFLNLEYAADAVNPYVVAFDRAGAFGLFDRIEVYDYLGGTLLEQTNNIPVLACLLNDVNGSIIDSCGKNVANAGFQTAVAQIDDDLATTAQTTFVRPPVSGGVVSALPVSAEKRFATVQFTLPVMSFLGMFSDKYIPLHNGFSVYFYLSGVDTALIARYRDTTTTTPKLIEQAWISNFEYVCDIMELGEQAEAIVTSSEPMVIHSKQYRHFADNILGNGEQSNFRFDLNLNVVSLRNVFFCMIPLIYQNNIQFPSYGHRIRNFLETWNFQYGSSYLPEIAGISCRANSVPQSRSGYTPCRTTPLGGLDYYKALGYTQALEELAKCSPNNMLTNIDQDSYMVDTAYASISDPYAAALSSAPVPWIYGSSVVSQIDVIGKFAGGLNTQLSKKATVSGIDTNGLQLSINGQFNRDLISYMAPSTLNVWAEHDSFIQIIPGVASTVTF